MYLLFTESLCYSCFFFYRMRLISFMPVLLSKIMSLASSSSKYRSTSYTMVQGWRSTQVTWNKYFVILEQQMNNYQIVLRLSKFCFLATFTWNTIVNSLLTSYSWTGLSLRQGALYSMRVAAVNKAGYMSSFETNGVIIDTTPPIVSCPELMIP